MIRAIIFDFDGLILDTETPEFASWQAIYAEHGCTLSRDFWTQSIGLPWGSGDIYGHLEDMCGRPVDREDVRARRKARFLEAIAAQPVMPGVAEYLAAAPRHGLRLGVASSSPRHWVHGHLTRLDLLHHFACIFCADDVERAKPHPDLYRAAIDALGVGPHEAIALEDSPNGVAAARAAGLYCVAVPNPMTCTLAFDQADLRVDSLAALPLDVLLTRVRVS